MMIFKVDWSNYDNDFIQRFKKTNPDVKLSEVFFNSENNTFYKKHGNYNRPLGCIACLTGIISQTDFGDITIGDLVLLNYKNFAIDNGFKIGNDIAEELATNIWLCPNCKRWIFDFLPKYNTMSIVGS